MRTKLVVPSTSDLNGSTASWTTTRTSLMEIRNPTSKSLGPRAYQNAEKTKRRKPLSQRNQKKMVKVEVTVVVTMTNTELTFEEALFSEVTPTVENLIEGYERFNRFSII